MQKPPPVLTLDATYTNVAPGKVPPRACARITRVVIDCDVEAEGVEVRDEDGRLVVSARDAALAAARDKLLAGLAPACPAAAPPAAPPAPAPPSEET
jgi:hypothetical protein